MNPRTADIQQSIWKDFSEDTFRSHLVLLEERTNAVPVDSQLFPVASLAETRSARHYGLSIRDEQTLADAFAFLAAVQEGAQSVAAVCLEEHIRQHTLTVRFAAVDTISLDLQQALHTVSIILGASGSPDDRDLRSKELFHFVVRLHFKRILGRLRSSKWEKPKYLSRTHKKSLWQDFDNLAHRVQFVYTKREKELRDDVQHNIRTLADTYSRFESVSAKSVEEFELLVHLIQVSYDFCTSTTARDYARRMSNAGQTNQVRAAVKTLRQIEKVAAYYRVPATLIRVSHRYPQYFRAEGLRMEYLAPYASVPTSIGYEDWARTCHVHAEIQLVVYYDMRSCDTNMVDDPNHDSLMPRVMGTSKYLCYLCYLFIKFHSGFPAANTHGRLYDQWTVPDLAEYSQEQRERYRQVIKSMDEAIMTHASKPPCWRAEPMTSRENLLNSVQEESAIVLSQSVIRDTARR
ncbi:uncharacterized protein PV06_01934 [Exophiala oligosperma]|uniref:Uncharacterized protein n=1 Tax=Exophiala oligosperma TaxID=215243 RepID=A0A0D2DT40_9EURO|nr:uncharacterized protein PV06_01934 [Exophiala oligosperma]KIW46253.1 hypothetical protein PV06_01934 [Exophiala oligosperma]